ncbi:helix-turn-helix transcriptional regulator [Nonomuraea longicatena]|uniref:AraC family transcriptional regulator n=1 Tax=Nonomuraea longicatena TaxID=83682 RepID=A0ABN1Q7Q4_9ACTN
MSQVWRGWCLLRPGILLYGGAIGTTRPHAHHAIHLIVSAEPFTMADAHGGRVTTRAAVVPSDTGHAIVAGARGALLAQIEPRSEPGRFLLARSGAGAEAASWGVPAEAFAFPGDPAEAAIALKGVEAWTGEPATVHPAVEVAMAVIPTLLVGGPVRLEAVAAAAHLSPSRLAHLFSAQVGIPLRPYVRWQRIQHAIRLVAAGESLTMAAHHAGFTDGPHFTRVFQRTFGAAPSTYAAAIDWLP